MVFCAVLLSGALLLGAARWLFFPREFRPVHLSTQEEKTLQGKMENLEKRGPGISGGGEALSSPVAETPRPQPHSEAGSRREIVLSEREVNALLARSPELARKLVLDFSDDLASADLILPLASDLPLLGGRTIRARAGLELRFEHGRPLVALRGVSLWGVPLPAAWLGNLKNVDLVETFGAGEGFWKSFAAGVEEIKVSDGKLRLRLKE
ncbi:MAG TPA: arginine N-succinyltransferase [Proteobacteria bacterium]|nr:arginine N-succinyltransferase [Pseudomonadota bacterium]